MSGAVVARMREKLRRLSLRVLAYFACGMALTLAFAVLLTGRVTRGVISRINERNTSTELAMVKASFERLNDEMVRQAATILTANYINTLRERDERSKLDEVFAVRAFYADVTAATVNFPIVHSVYLLLDDGYALCGTVQNMQRFIGLNYADYPALASGALSGDEGYLGGLTTRDFPFNFDRLRSRDYELVTYARRARGLTLAINLYADGVSEMYSVIADAQSGDAYVVGDSGRVISASDGAATGETYASSEIVKASTSGQYVADGARTQIVWTTLEKAGLTIVNEVALESYWSDLNLIVRTMLAVIAVGLLAACAALYFVLRRAFAPVDTLRASMTRAGAGDYGGILPERGIGEMAALTRSYNEMLREIRLLTERTAQAEQEKRVTELRALRNQINPHFLFNTLSTIKWMCLSQGNRQAADCITSLGNIIQPMFRSEAPYCALAEELASLRSYVSIMNTRLGGGIALSEEIAPEALPMKVLRMLLQPIAENSITHGFDGGGGGITLRAEVERGGDGEALVISLSDDGRGIGDAKMDMINASLRAGAADSGVGLSNTARRIRLNYGPEAGAGRPAAAMWLERAPSGGVKTVVRLPAEGM